jgi:hypothetical protein
VDDGGRRGGFHSLIHSPKADSFQPTFPKITVPLVFTTCFTGVPSPQIRDGNFFRARVQEKVPLQGSIRRGGSRTAPTSSLANLCGFLLL